MLPKSRIRVNQHTADHVNQQIRQRMKEDLEYCIKAGPKAIDSRLRELDGEWDIERTLEANAAFFSLAGLLLGKTVHRNFYMLPAAVAGFLMQHALQGWCPPISLFRRRGVRTIAEIDAERTALKMIRGDFRSAGEAAGEGRISAESLMKAVDADMLFESRHNGRRGQGGMPERDTAGICEGECRDRVFEGEQERQAAINRENIETPETPHTPGAERRTEQPGVWGGHV